MSKQPPSTKRPPHPTADTIGTIDLDRIKPSPANPRKTFHGVEDLADSIRAVGLLEDLRVRPIGESVSFDPQKGWQGVDHFDLVDGERRFRAAKLAGLKRVQCKVRVMTDDEAAIARLISFDQKEGLPASEHAAAYRERRDAGMTDEAIAAAVGKPLDHVRGLLAAAKLPPFALAAMDRGELAHSIAALIGRIPGEADRENAAARVLLGDAYGDVEEGDLASLRKGKDPASINPHCEPLTFRQARELIASYQISLKGAPFRKALDLVEGVPTCEACPKRAGNAATTDEAYKSLRADTCLDPSCFKGKLAAWNERSIEKHRKAGRQVLNAEAAAKIFIHGNTRCDAPHIDLDHRCFDDPNQRTYGELLKGKVTPTIAIDGNGQQHELLTRQEAKEAIKALGLKVSDHSEADRKRAAEERRKQEVGRAAGMKAMETVAERMERDFRLPEGFPTTLMRAILEALADVGGADSCHLVTKRRKLESKGNADGYRTPVKKLIEDLDTNGLAGLLGELLAAKKVHHWGHPYFGTISAEEREWWSRWGINTSDLMKAAAAERKEAKAAKTAKKKGKSTASKSDEKSSSTDETQAETDESSGNADQESPGSGRSAPTATAGRSLLESPLKRPDPEIPAGAAGRRVKLRDVPRLADDVVRDLEQKGWKTLADLRPLVDRQKEQVPDTTRTALYLALAPTLGTKRAGGAADAIVELLMPKPSGKVMHAQLANGPATIVAHPDNPIFETATPAHGDPSEWQDLIDAARPVGDLPLQMVEHFPLAIAKSLEVRGIKTLSHFEARLETETAGRDGESLGMKGLILQTIEKVTGIGGLLAVNATEALVNHLTLGGIAEVQKCRVCGCTEDDCSQCIEASGRPCSWVKGQPNLCTRCKDEQDAAAAKQKAERTQEAAKSLSLEGESIEALGVSATELMKASIVNKWPGPKLAMDPVEVTPVYIAGIPHVVTSTVATTPPGSSGKLHAWYCLPLWTKHQFEIRHPGIAIRTDPRDTSGGQASLHAGGSHIGTAVTVSGYRDFVLGSHEETRRLVEVRSSKKRQGA
jgi:ParB/RepB/Spo0J family partition protein